MRRTSLVVGALLAVAGCGDEARRAAPAPALPGDAAVAPRATTPALLAAVPDDTAFVLAVREPLPAAAWDRLAWDLAPFVGRLAAIGESYLADAGVVDPVERLLAALAAELPGPLGADTRAVAYELRRLPVVRIEVADEAALRAAIERATSRAGVAAAAPMRWIAEGEGGAVALVVAGRQLAVTHGDAAAVRALVPVLAGDEPLGSPAIDPAALPAVGGRIDLGAVARDVEPGDDAPPACKAALRAALDRIAPLLPRLAITLPVVTPERVELRAAVEHAPLLAAATSTQPGVTPGVPATFPGRPIVALSFVSPPSLTDDALGALWQDGLVDVIAACDAGAQTAALPSGAGVRGLAIAAYDANTDTMFPTDVQAYVATIARDPAALWRSLGVLPSLRNAIPADGAGFRKLPVKDMAPFVATAHAARAGDSLVLALGKTGKDHAATALAATEPPPLVHLFLDVARLYRAGDDGDDDVAPGLWSEADLGASLARLVDTFDLALGGELRVVAVLAARADQPAPVANDPRRAECRRLHARLWPSARRSLARLGITDGLDAYEDRVLTGFDAGTFRDQCADKLTDAARACLLAAADPLAALADCGAGDLEPPRLFDPFGDGPHPVAQRLGAGAPTISALAGTWSHADPDRRETWTIEPSGKAVHRAGTQVERYQLAIDGIGDVRTIQGNGWSHSGFVLDGDTLYLGGSPAYPLADEARFIAGFRRTFEDAWFVQDAQGCVAIDERGRTAPATCRFEDRGTERWLVASSALGHQEYLVIAHHLASLQLADQRFWRVK